MRWVMRCVCGDCSSSNDVDGDLELIVVVEHVLAMK